MSVIAALLIAVGLLDVGFLAGCIWNGRAYDRGREDGYSVGYREGVNNALGRRD